MGPFGRAAVGLIVNKDGTSKKKKEDGVGTLKGGRRNAGTLPSWLKDDLPDEKTAKDGKEKPAKEGKDKWVKESKEKSKKSSSSGKSHIDEEVEMEISAPIPDEDFRLATSLLGLNRIKTRSGPLHFPAASTRSGPVFAGTVQSRFDTGNEGKREDKAVNSWSKGESSTKLLSGGRKASKVHARDSVSPEEFSPAEESSYNRRSSLPGESTDMGASPLSETSPGSSNLKKLQRSSRIGELEKAFGGRPGSGLRVEGSGDGSHPGSQFGSSWATSAGGSRGVGNPGSLHAPDFSSLGPSIDHKSSHGKASDDDAEAQEAESPTESPRFKALLRMTGSKGKRPTDIKSFSHELDPRGVRSHEFFRPHNLGGFNDLEEFLNTLRARFNTAKEGVNAELAVFAGDVIEILEKNADAAPDWLEKAEDLLILAKECAMMNAQEFRKSCEAIVHDLDEKRQELSMGVLKQLHTRLLFILTRCTRLVQYQKRNFLELDLLRLQKVEKFWQEDNSKRPSDVRSDPVKIRKPSSPPRFRPNDVGSIQRRPKDEGIHSKPSMPSIRETEPKADLTANKVEDIKDELSNIIIDRITSWKKFPPPSERKSSVERPDLKQQTPEKDPSQFSPSLFPPLKQRIPEHDPSLTKVSKPQPPPKRQQKVPPQDEKPMVICRICEEEVPTVHLEEHSRVCAFADRCDHKGLGVDERLRRLAETLEHLVESYTPKSSLVAASASPDTAKTSSGGDPETIIAEKLTSVSEKLGAYERGGGDLFRRGSEDMLEDLHEIDTASILDEPRVFNAIACKTRFGPKADPLVALASSVGSLLAPSSSVGSITPRSPLATPKNSQIDLLLTDRSNFAESENLQQINELADIARCIADRCPAPDKGGSEYIVECLEDLKDVLQQNRVEALTVDTFGRRIEKLCREKHQQILEALGQHTPESLAHTPDENISMEDDGSQNCIRTPVHPIHKDRTSIDDFEIIKPISRGAFGRVFLARKRITGDLFAIKVLRKADMIRKNAVESVQAERNILISVRNPFVVRFFYSFTCSENLYLVMEYLNGGDVFSMLRNLGCLEEEMARVYIAELVLALEYLHGLGVVHRDLKPDNLLIAHDGHIKLTDFGLSKVGLINSTDDLSGPTVGGASLMEEITKHHKASDQPQQRERRQQRSAVGTPDYLAPEILLGTSHGPAADWWSTGVILFECLTGMPPFNAEHPQIIFDNILNRNIPWPQVPEDMSYEAQDLIDRLLTEDPDERLGAKGAAEVKAHPFFKDINWDTLARQKAAFVPSPDNAHDTSYFTSRHGWNSVEARVFTEHGYESSDYESSASGRSTSSSETRIEDPELVDVAGPLKEQCRDMADFDRDSSTKFSFSNFSFKNLSQLASINYDLLLQTSQDAALPKGPATSPS